MGERCVRFLFVNLVVLLAGTPAAFAQHDGGGSGCGDVFGDLVHVMRDAGTGVPVLQKRWVALPQDVYGWAYCPIALDASGTPLSFLPDSCDIDSASGTPVAVDYFGRLSAGRTKERNVRMHFDEVIEKISASEAVSRDATGRLALGTACTAVAPDAASCATWSVVDSPVENLALYVRVMKYGHIQTDPGEVDVWAHGDPTLPTQYHPALAASDHAKFVGEARSLLPTTSACPGAGAACFAPEALQRNDFVIAASMLAGGADKTGKATIDLVQYLNRILKISVATPYTAATHDVLFPKYRDCGAVLDAQPGTPGCDVLDANATFPAPANEPFVDFAALAYDRTIRFAYTVEAIVPADSLALPRLAALPAILGVASSEVWLLDGAVSLLDWLVFINGAGGATGAGIDGFVKATSDAIRAIEFVHNYAVPLDLGWDFTSP